MIQELTIENALKAWTDVLGKDRVKKLHNQGLPNLGGHRKRIIPASLHPRTTQEIVAIVKIANQYKIPLYPFSIGKNWSLGSKNPVKDHCVLVDLSDMCNIIELNKDLRYIVIEPGVSQEQVAQHLKQSGMMASFGGGGTTISLVGNVLDRGTGLFGDRTSDILAMEVVLGNGKVIRTGLWNFHNENDENNFQHCYPPGLGPDLKGLFVQGCLGIITKMVLRLVPKTQWTISRIAYQGEGSTFIQNLKNLKETNVIDPGLKFLPRVDNNLYYPGFGSNSWECIGALSGTPDIRKAKKEAIQSAFYEKDKADITFVDMETYNENEQKDGWWKDHIEKYTGNITNSHLYSFYKMGGGKEGGDISKGNYDLPNNPDVPGFFTLNLVVPFQVKTIETMIKITREISNTFNLSPVIGIGDLHHYALKGHVGISFDRKDPKAAENIHAWKNALYEAFFKEGMYPQRLDISSMNDFCKKDQNSYWQTIAELKKAIDPYHIISPGRYLC